MRKFFCLIALATFLSTICGEAVAQKHSRRTSRGAVASPFPKSEVEISLAGTWPKTTLLAGLKTKIEEQWLQQGQFWFSRETSDGTIRHIGDLSCRLQPTELTSPDHLNGIQWRGLVLFSWKAERFYLPGEEKWTRWEEGNTLLFRMTAENGKTKLESLSAILNPLTREVSELEKPEAEQVKLILGKPAMTAAESEQMFPPKPSDSRPAKPGEKRPSILFMPKPEYSTEARTNKISGKVVLWVEVLPDGTTGRLQILKPLGYGLDEKAMETVRKGRFLPALKGGKPVTATARVEVSFKISVE
jgi:TonB family protein